MTDQDGADVNWPRAYLDTEETLGDFACVSMPAFELSLESFSWYRQGIKVKCIKSLSYMNIKLFASSLCLHESFTWHRQGINQMHQVIMFYEYQAICVTMPPSELLLESFSWHRQGNKLICIKTLSFIIVK